MKNLTMCISLGFTLIELTITITIIAILTAVALPSFSNLLANSKVSNISHQLQTSLNMARNHAIMNQYNVIVCPASNKQLNECRSTYASNTNWQHGWLIYQDDNNNNELDAADQLLHVFKSNGAAVVFNQQGRLRFFPDGSARSAGFYICSDNSARMRHIYLLYSGRSRVDQNLTDQQRNICKNSI